MSPVCPGCQALLTSALPPLSPGGGESLPIRRISLLSGYSTHRRAATHGLYPGSDSRRLCHRYGLSGIPPAAAPSFRGVLRLVKKYEVRRSFIGSTTLPWWTRGAARSEAHGKERETVPGRVHMEVGAGFEPATDTVLQTAALPTELRRPCARLSPGEGKGKENHCPARSGLVHPQGCEPRRRRQKREKPTRTDACWSRLRTKPIRATSGWTCLLHGDGYPIPRYHKTWALILSPQSRWWDRPDSNRHHVGLCGPDALPFKLLSHVPPSAGGGYSVVKATEIAYTPLGCRVLWQRGSDARSVRFRGQLLLQIVDVGQCVLNKGGVAT